VATEHGRSG